MVLVPRHDKFQVARYMDIVGAPSHIRRSPRVTDGPLPLYKARYHDFCFRHLRSADADDDADDITSRHADIFKRREATTRRRTRLRALFIYIYGEVRARFYLANLPSRQSSVSNLPRNTAYRDEK